MNDIKIDLNNINPQEFFGDQNINLNKLRSSFPKLKLVPRGNLLRAYRDPQVLNQFKGCMNSLIDYFGIYNSLDSNFIEEVVSSKNNIDFSKYKEESESIILHGVNGKIHLEEKIHVHMIHNPMVQAYPSAGPNVGYMV